MRNGIGDEDVLDGDEPEHEPVERSRFHRKRDVAAAALITAAAVVGGLLVWQGSDIRATTSTTYDAPVTSPAPLTAFPPSLAESWRAPSSATPVPVTVGPALVTGDGGDVVGRDPITGEERWRYSRDLELCTLTSAWSLAVAVYARTENLLPADDPRKAGGCSEITALDPASGQRGRDDGGRPDLGQRNSDAELGTRLLFDGSYVTATGDRLLHTYRSDLVLTMEYGEVPTLVNPDRQPRTDCDYGTVAVEEGRIAVVERCPIDPSDRLTVYRATGDDSSEEPEVTFSVATGARGARVLAMSDECRIGMAEGETQLCTVVVAPDPAQLLVYDEEGVVVARHRLSLAPGDLP
ncbi:MAG TPA: hypothetical protein VHH15_18180, partial [Actinophytocola sp.]|nr:hypothetical protein [Actinophytocola sp.]